METNPFLLSQHSVLAFIQKCIEDCKDEQVKAQMLFCYKDFAINMAHMQMLPFYTPTQGFQGINLSMQNMQPQYN